MIGQQQALRKNPGDRKIHAENENNAEVLNGINRNARIMLMLQLIQTANRNEVTNANSANANDGDGGESQ